MSNAFDILIKCFDEENYDYKTDVLMGQFTTFKIGGPCKVMVFPRNRFEIIKILGLCKNLDIKYYVFGRCSNILISDNGIDGVVLLLSNKYAEISLLEDNVIECDSGVSLARLCYFAYLNSLSGIEFAWGIPGSVGGAVYMNAGAYGGEIKDVILSSMHLNDQGIEEKIYRENLELDYRKSMYSGKNYCITKLYFKLCFANKKDIKDKMDDFMSRRISKQPLDYPSAGSIFKRPVGNYAGALISECGLKGFTIGGAMVSDKHAGFIVNAGGATCKDVETLINHIRETVFKNTGYMLECEVKKI